MADAGRPADFTDLNPEYAKRLANFRSALDQAGIRYSVVSGYRTPEYQNQMYQNHLAKQANQPLPYPGVEAPNVVAPAWRSFHNYGLAADFTAVDPNDYARIRAMAPQFGLSGIGASDPGHIQMAGSLADNIERYNLGGWRPETRPAPTEGAVAYGGTPPQPSANLAARGTGGASVNAPAGSIAAQHEAFIRDYAQKIGLNPDVALGIARAEGMNATGFRTPNQASTVDVSGGQPFSFGDFQLNVKGGMGVDALKAGIDPSNAGQWQKADMFALDRMKAGGIKPWTDPFARQWIASGRPITGGGTTLTSTPPGVVDPGIVAHGGTSPPIPDVTVAGGTAAPVPAPAAPPPATFGEAIGKGDVGGALAAINRPSTTTSTDAKGNTTTTTGATPLEKIAGAFGGKDDGGRAAPEIPALPTMTPVQDPNAGLAPAAQQLFQAVSANAAKPLTWNARPYGYNAGFQGTTLNQTDYGNG